MIKLFNTIRKSLISENKFTKYLLYAFGEVILVVIGILLALSINNYNETRKKEAKLNTLFLEIQGELGQTINQYTRGIEYYERKDSIIVQILDNKFTKESYKENPSLAYPIINYNIVKVQDKAYLNLVAVSDILSENQNALFDDLKLVYEFDKGNLETTQEKFTDFIFKFISDASDSKKWYIDYVYQNNLTDEILDYLVSDPFYKNKVLDYTIYYNNLNLEQYKTNALKSYKSLASFTGVKNHIPEYYFRNSEDLTEFTGDFELVSESKVFIKDGKNNFCNIRLEETKLYLTLFGNREYELFPHTENTFIFSNGDRAQVKFIMNKANSVTGIQFYNESEYTNWEKTD